MEQKGYYNRNIYFETSAVNFLLKDFSIGDCHATRSLQLAKGNRWYLSPVTLWEIQLTPDAVDKEQMLEKAKLVFYKKLLLSPAEILLLFIDAKAKPKPNIHSETMLAKSWMQICENPFLSWEMGDKGFKKASDRFKNFSRKIDLIIGSIVLEIKPDDEIKKINILIDTVFKIVYKDQVLPPHAIKILKINLLMITALLCIGIDIDPGPIQQFWKSKGVSNVHWRLVHLLTSYPVLVEGGPLMLASFLAYSQLKMKKSRGLLHDALHCLYLPLVDVLFTNDADFKEFKKTGLSPDLNKIIHVDEMNISKTRTWVDYEPLL